MNISNRSSLITFYRKHPKSKIQLEVWYEEVMSKKWKSPNYCKADYGTSVSILKNNRVVFNIKGNEYRIVAAINYENGWLFIKFIGTHSEYDKINANSIDFFKLKSKRKGN